MGHAEELERIENKAIDELNDRFKASIRKTIEETDWSDIERRLAAMQEPGDVADAVAWQGYDPRAYLEEEIFPAASEISAAYIADVVAAGSSLSFTLTDPNALKWLKEYGAEEIKYISESQRQAIKEIITSGYRDGVTYQQQAREIRQLIGLDPRWAEAVQQMRARLMGRGLISDDEIDRRAAKYAAKLLNKRARNIAVQEATTAGARAFYETTADACNRGILDPHIYEGYRIVTGDERLCPQCSALAGEGRRLPDGAYQSSGSVTPKLHNLCRCVEGVREITMIKKVIKKETKESEIGYAAVIFESRGLKRKGGMILCPTVPLVEGVFAGRGFPVLREYSEFSRDSKWLNGLTVLTNHEDLTPAARRVGQLTDIANRPEGKKVTAVTQFFESDLTPREVEAIMSRKPIHGSLRFACALDMTPGEWVNSNGETIHYEAIERGPYVFYEYSMVPRGIVTPEDGAGFNMECGACKTQSEADFTDKPWDGSASRYKDTDAYCAACLIDLNEPGKDKIQANCKLPVREPDGTYNKNAIRNALARISQLKGVPAKELADAKKKLASLAKQAGIGESQSSAPGGATMEEDLIKEMIEEAIRPLKEQNAALEQKNAALEGEVQALKESQKAAQDAAVLESFASKLKPGYTEKAKELFEAYQKDPAGWVVENADKFVQPGQERRLKGSSSTEGGQAFDLQAEQDKLWGRAI